jgi:NAD+ synthetase
MKFALLQLDLTVGDLRSNASKIAAAAESAAEQGAELCVATELALCGYPPRDLLLSNGFIDQVGEALQSLATNLAEAPPLLVGFPERNPGEAGKPLYNSAALLHGGSVKRVFRKTLLPSYDVFDEDRYFSAGDGVDAFEAAGARIAVTVCEDIWNDTSFWERPLYRRDPLEDLSEVDVIVNLSASPFSLGKQQVRLEMVSALARRHKAHVLFANQVGGNDDLLFAGRSMACAPDGSLYAGARAFAQDILLGDTEGPAGTIHADDFAPESEAWRALVMGTRDYVNKCGFSRAVIGLSGGIDSSLTAAVAAEALGPGSVLGVLMPSTYTRPSSLEDARALAENLGINTLEIAIDDLMRCYDHALSEAFKGKERDVTEENIQARIRGNLLMALSNKFGHMVLTTGNKSELSVGYCTIYGDMAGGLAVLADVPKTLAYRVCRWINESRGRDVVPAGVIEKPPSAELRPDQQDQDSLPPYDVLDAVLERLIRRHMSRKEIVAEGFDPETVDRIARMVKNAEFKRRQAPPGLKITDVSFGTGWRMPVAARVDE